MLSASHWLLAQARFCGRTHLPLSPNSTTPTVQVIFRYLRPDAPVFNITTVGIVRFRQSPCWYYPWADIILSTSSDTQYLWTWWYFGDHTSLINLSVNNIRHIHIRRSRWYITFAICALDCISYINRIAAYILFIMNGVLLFMLVKAFAYPSIIQSLTPHYRTFRRVYKHMGLTPTTPMT